MRVKWANEGAYGAYVLGHGADAGVTWRDLVQQVDVRHRVLDVTGEVGDLAAAGAASQVVVDPADEDLLGRQLHEVLQTLAVQQQRRQVRVLVQVDVAQQTNLYVRMRTNTHALSVQLQIVSRPWMTINTYILIYLIVSK